MVSIDIYIYIERLYNKRLILNRNNNFETINNFQENLDEAAVEFYN